MSSRGSGGHRRGGELGAQGPLPPKRKTRRKTWRERGRAIPKVNEFQEELDADLPGLSEEVTKKFKEFREDAFKLDAANSIVDGDDVSVSSQGSARSWIAQNLSDNEQDLPPTRASSGPADVSDPRNQMEEKRRRKTWRERGRVTGDEIPKVNELSEPKPQDRMPSMMQGVHLPKKERNTSPRRFISQENHDETIAKSFREMQKTNEHLAAESASQRFSTSMGHEKGGQIPTTSARERMREYDEATRAAAKKERLQKKPSPSTGVGSKNPKVVAAGKRGEKGPQIPTTSARERIREYDEATRAAAKKKHLQKKPSPSTGVGSKDPKVVAAEQSRNKAKAYDDKRRAAQQGKRGGKGVKSPDIIPWGDIAKEATAITSEVRNLGLVRGKGGASSRPVNKAKQNSPRTKR